jgi:hypothetical protein
MLALVLVGCASREDPSEPLPQAVAHREAVLARRFGTEARLEHDERGLVFVRDPSCGDDDYALARRTAEWFIERGEPIFHARFDRPVTVVIARGRDAMVGAAARLGVAVDDVAVGRYSREQQTLFSDTKVGNGNLTHELTHMLIHAGLDWRDDCYGLPYWLDEAFAGAFEGVISGSTADGARIADLRHDELLGAWWARGAVPDRPAYLTIDRSQVPPTTLAWLIAGEHAPEHDAIERALGRELVLYIRSRGALPRFFDAVAAALRAHPDASDADRAVAIRRALEEVLGAPLERIERDLVAWSTGPSRSTP